MDDLCHTFAPCCGFTKPHKETKAMFENELCAEIRAFSFRVKKYGSEMLKTQYVRVFDEMEAMK